MYYKTRARINEKSMPSLSGERDGKKVNENEVMEKERMMETATGENNEVHHGTDVYHGESVTGTLVTQRLRGSGFRVQGSGVSVMEVWLNLQQGDFESGKTQL